MLVHLVYARTTGELFLHAVVSFCCATGFAFFAELSATFGGRVDVWFPARFPSRFRWQCNSDPVLVTEKGLKMPDQALLLYFSCWGKQETLPQEGTQQLVPAGGTV